MRVLVTLIVLLVSDLQPALSQSWLDVGDGWYVDRSSAKRNGDVATILARHISKMDVTDVVTFDCKNGIATNWNWSAPLPTKGLPSLLKAQELACKHPWEVWK